MEIAAVRPVYFTVRSVLCWYNCQIQKGGLSSKSIKSAEVFNSQRPLNWELQWILWLPLMAILAVEHRYTIFWHMKHLNCVYVEEKQFWSGYRAAVVGSDHQGSSLKRPWLHHIVSRYQKYDLIQGYRWRTRVLPAAGNFLINLTLNIFLVFLFVFPFSSPE